VDRLRVALLGTEAAVESDDPRTLALARARLSGMIADPEQDPPAVVSRIVARRGAAAAREMLASSRSAGYSGTRRVLLGEREVVAYDLWPAAGVALRWVRHARGAEQTTVLRDRWFERTLKRAARRLPASFYREQLVVLGGLFPLLYELQTQGWALVHAGLVRTPRGGVLVVGAGGSGKSTLALALSARPGCSLASDNLALVRGVEAAGVPEPVKLSRWTAEAVRQLGVDVGMTDVQAGWDRQEGRSPRAGSPLPVIAVVLPWVADESRAEAAQGSFESHAAAAAALAYETQAYAKYAAALWLADGGERPGEASLVAPRLGARVPMVRLTMRRGAPLVETVATLEGALDGVLDAAR
jgi:hypothetical protein